MNARMRSQIVGLMVGCMIGGCQEEQQSSVRWGNAASHEKRASQSGQEMTPMSESILPETHVAAGRLHESHHHLARAARQYHMAIGLSPTHVEAHNRLGIVLDKQGRYAEADEAFLRAIELAPDKSYLYNNLGFSYTLQQRWSEAEQVLRRALSIDPDFVRARVNLGMSLAQLGRWADGLYEFEQALPREDAYYNLGLLYQGKRMGVEAASAYRTALTINPKLVAAKKRFEMLPPEIQAKAEAFHIVAASPVAVTVDPVELAGVEENYPNDGAVVTNTEPELMAISPEADDVIVNDNVNENVNEPIEAAVVPTAVVAEEEPVEEAVEDSVEEAVEIAELPKTEPVIEEPVIEEDELEETLPEADATEPVETISEPSVETHALEMETLPEDASVDVADDFTPYESFESLDKLMVTDDEFVSLTLEAEKGEVWETWAEATANQPAATQPADVVDEVNEVEPAIELEEAVEVQTETPYVASLDIDSDEFVGPMYIEGKVDHDAKVENDHSSETMMSEHAFSVSIDNLLWREYESTGLLIVPPMEVIREWHVEEDYDACLADEPAMLFVFPQFNPFSLENNFLVDPSGLGEDDCFDAELEQSMEDSDARLDDEPSAELASRLPE